MEKPDSIDLDRTIPRGFVDARRATEGLDFTRIPPVPGLEGLFENHYLIKWDVAEARTERHRILPSPNANLLFGVGRPALAGVVTRLRVEPAGGCGYVFGSRFRIGALRPYLPFAMSRLTDQSVDASVVTGIDDVGAADYILREPDCTSMALALRELVVPMLKTTRPAGEHAEAMVAFIRGPARPVRVEELVKAFRTTQRSVQRLFQEHVGVSPKWTIRRYRLQDAAFQVGRGAPRSLADVASELGYFDQAHLAKEFTSLFGMSPSQFRESQTSQ